MAWYLVKHRDNFIFTLPEIGVILTADTDIKIYVSV